MSEHTAPATAPDRFLIGIVAGAALLVVLAVVAVVWLRQAPAPPPADLSTPTGVVQAYIEAIRAGDADRAHALLTQGAREATPLAEYRRSLGGRRSADASGPRLQIEPASVTGDVAEVRVVISRFYAGSGPFSTSTSHQDLTVRLEREDGAWRIAQPTTPYAFW